MRVARTAIRFPLKASVDFWWKDELGNAKQGEGLSRDISERGAFVYAAVCPPAGAPVRLRLSLEGFPGGTRDMRMEIEGQVLRVEETSGSAANRGFAVFYEYGGHLEQTR
jgi:hypothetical protein